ncbi:hypothetical protein ACLB1T_22660 [Escherichia coli]
MSKYPQDKLDHPWALAFLPDNHDVNHSARRRVALLASRKRSHPRRFPEFRTFGRTGRAACWTWVERLILLSLAPYLAVIPKLAMMAKPELLWVMAA